MDKSPLVPRKKKGFCCCFQSEDSDSESSINLPRVESDISPSVLEPAIYTSKKFAADKIYFLGNGPHKFLATFRHLVVESGEEQVSPSESPNNVSDEHWKERYRIFSRFSEGAQIGQDMWGKEVFEKISKALVRTLLGRGSLEKVLIEVDGAGSLAIQFAKNMKVVALGNSEEKLECLKKNSEVYDVSENIEVRKEDLFSCTEKANLVFVSFEGKAHKAEALHLSIFLPNLANLIAKGFEIADSVMLLFPPTLDCYDFIDNIEHLDINPCIEFFLVFDHNHLKYVACLMGSLTKFIITDIVNSIMSKLGLSSRQKEFVFTAIQETSLKRVLQVMEEVEKEAKSGSAIERIKHKSKRFFEIIRSEDNVQLKNLIFLQKGENGDDVARNLEEMNLYFVEIDVPGPSVLEMNGNRIEGFSDILQYLEEFKIKETPNKNSLFLLIDS